MITILIITAVQCCVHDFSLGNERLVHQQPLPQKQKHKITTVLQATWIQGQCRAMWENVGVTLIMTLSLYNSSYYKRLFVCVSECLGTGRSIKGMTDL